MSNDEDSQPHITKFVFRSKFLAYVPELAISFFINLPTEFFHFPIHLAIGDFMQVCILLFFTHLLYGSIFFINKKMLTFSNEKPSTSLGKNLQIKSTLVCHLAEHEQREQEPQEQSSSLTDHLISQSNSDKNDAIMESFSTQSPLPYNVEHEKDERVQTQVLPPVAPHSHVSQEHVMSNELIVNQKQICLCGHPPQTNHYVDSQQGPSIGNAQPKDERQKSPHQ
jgi:hypothetical protein